MFSMLVFMCRDPGYRNVYIRYLILNRLSDVPEVVMWISNSRAYILFKNDVSHLKGIFPLEKESLTLSLRVLSEHTCRIL